MKAPIPANEALRLRSLQLYDILDTLPEKAFDEITQLAAHICGCPIATVSIIDRDRQWYKSCVGFDAGGSTSRDIAFCAHTINQNNTLVVPDTLNDERFADNPVVTDGPKVRFYAGSPLVNKDGFGLGTLCVVDVQPRELTADQKGALEALSRHVVILLELRRAEKELSKLNVELESRVALRTKELNVANDLLKAEIEDKERLQKQMVQSQKMEAIGRLAGGIAHDFNNILQVMAGYCELLLDDPELSHRDRIPLLEIQKSGGRATALVRQLLTFSRQQLVEPKTLDLNEIVDNMSGMLRRLIGTEINFVIKAGKDLRPIISDVNQIEQVLMNLVINARDAMTKGGDLIVDTSSVVLTEPLECAGGEIEPNTYTVLTVRDTGSGMSEEVRSKIFEPFFTTKAMGKGTGLGLATSFGIVQQSNGFIRCNSELGLGTTFEVYLPALLENPSKSGRLLTISPRGQETILLVEDEASVRQLTCLRLRNLGYTVYDSADGLEALAIAQTRSTLKIDLLISDVVMPNLNGRDLMKRLVELRPEMKCILMSSFTDEALLQGNVSEPQPLFLQKPFTKNQLGLRVREVLDPETPDS